LSKMERKASDLKEQILLAALDCSGEEGQRTFSFEELLVRAWQRDPVPWGLRGFEQLHPDSERIHRELDSRGKTNKGVVGLGLLEKVSARVYRLTPRGLAAASRLAPADVRLKERVERTLEGEIRRIIEHRAFREWLKDPSRPKHFRDAGHFWGIAAGTPPRVIRERLHRVEATLETAREVLMERGMDGAGDKGGAVAFDLEDISRAQEFQRVLLERFASELKILGG